MKRFFQARQTTERMQEGPWGRYLVLLAEQLQRQGYTKESVSRKLRLAAGFIHWLQRKHTQTHQVTAQHARDYLQSRQRAGYPSRQGEQVAVAQVLKLLGEQRVTARPPPEPILTPTGSLLAEYDVYLQKERSLTLGTRIHYRPFVQQFLASRFGNRRVNLGVLRAADVVAFVQRCAGPLKNQRAQLLTTALRSFLRFARYRGEIRLDLAACVPTVASWSCSTLPKSLPPAQVEQVLVGCNRRTVCGKRDYAILLLLARLGLRAGEVAGLALEDLDWESGCITLRGKMNRLDQLPLPAEVGEAIVAYLKDGRPHMSGERRLFLRVRAPLTGFKDQKAVGSVVKHALARAGIDSPRKGAHQFRHSLASKLLRQGHSLSEIGQLLRHRSPQTTAIYAKVDLRSLRSLALPWPGGGR